MTEYFLKLFLCAVALASSSIAQGSTNRYKECPTMPAGMTELDFGLCICKSVVPDAIYDSSKICSLEVLSSSSQFPPPSPTVRPSGNNRAFVLVEPMAYMIGETQIEVLVPAGFVTDYASIPEGLWSLYSPHDQYSRAAVIHDFLYWSQKCTRLQADNIFLIAMKESNVPNKVSEAVHFFVRRAGGRYWEENRRERLAGFVRVVPRDRKDFAPNMSWSEYRSYLSGEGVRDPEFPAGNYCKMGDSTDVPRKRTSVDLISPKFVERRISN